ncbi:hypothetical protein ADICEAN_00619 [Cesiribacter andamanensis AMV16]|uniref:Uncharacterized protein n=1 Tax=Cesiribacter andamanensis AMV16 TaxID=1279009 RepID=M7NAI3_9BACT|nr:hypothetical protein ADICEAN_00619 [Cesiribacter andamanensis AMV16]
MFCELWLILMRSNNKLLNNVVLLVQHYNEIKYQSE